jgi:hypothetical protein
MPKIPGVEIRPTPLAPLRPRLIPAPGTAAVHPRGETGKPIPGVYSGPPAKLNVATVKRLATIGACLVLAAVLGSYAIKTIQGIHQPGSDAPPARQDSASSTPPDSVKTDSAPKPLYASQSNPEIATVNELAQPWSSRKFFYRSLTESKYVPGLIVRLPGPAAQSKSYWAFSLEAPFNQCQFEYVDDLAKISSDYGFAAKHPMVVNPCSHSVFDPLQLKEVSGNMMVRGAIVQGHDVRPPYAIDVKVAGNQIQVVAME